MNPLNPAPSATIHWSPCTRYDHGAAPSIALDARGVAVEVHKSEDSLWYRVGTVDPLYEEISWGGSVEYDAGVHPAVAIQEGIAIAVHRSLDSDTLWYRVGTIDLWERRIAWETTSLPYGAGERPAIALNQAGMVVEVHRSLGDQTLWCRAGRLNPEDKSIAWGRISECGQGFAATVALNDDGRVILTSWTMNSGETLCEYRVGAVRSPGLGLEWRSAMTPYDAGEAPAVALDNAGRVFEVHKAGDRDTLCCHMGLMEGDRVVWGPGKPYDTGAASAIAVNAAGMTVEVHEADDHDTLWYHVAVE